MRFFEHYRQLHPEVAFLWDFPSHEKNLNPMDSLG